MPRNGEYIAVECHGGIDPDSDLGWTVCRHGYGVQAFGDGYMSHRVAAIRAGLLNAGLPVSGTDNDGPCQVGDSALRELHAYLFPERYDPDCPIYEWHAGTIEDVAEIVERRMAAAGMDIPTESLDS